MMEVCARFESGGSHEKASAYACFLIRFCESKPRSFRADAILFGTSLFERMCACMGELALQLAGACVAEL
jgi:hypothetical protein